jgi:hypothetical protein
MCNIGFGLPQFYLHVSYFTVKPEIFCEVSMGSQEHRTPAVVTLPQQDPKWNSSMQFLIKDINEDVLCITVRDKGHFSPDGLLKLLLNIYLKYCSVV